MEEVEIRGHLQAESTNELSLRDFPPTGDGCTNRQHPVGTTCCVPQRGIPAQCGGIWIW